MLTPLLDVRADLVRDGTEELVLASYENFLETIDTARSAGELGALVAPDSPMMRALEGESADLALDQFRDMLSRFQRTQTSVKVSGGEATVTAQGKTPVLDPNIAKYLQVANVTHIVTFHLEESTWKVVNNDYKVRYSD